MGLDPNYADWQQGWNNRHTDDTDNGIRTTNSVTNPLAMIWGGTTGKWDPISEGIHSIFGGNNPQKNAANVQWQDGDQDVYKQMDKKQWDELAGYQPIYQRKWIEKRKEWLKMGHDDQGNPVKPGVFYDPQTGKSGMTAEDQAASDKAAADKAKADKDEADYQAWRKSSLQKLGAYADEMNMPVEQLIARGDLGVKNAGNTGMSMASGASLRAGASGGSGISDLNTQRAVTDAQSKYQLNRSQLGMQALNGLNQGLAQMGHDREDTRRYEQNMNLQMQQAAEQARQFKFAQDQKNAAGPMGAIGGIIGGLYGGPQGAQAGYNIGAGAGASTVGSYQPKGLSYPTGSSYPGSGSQ